MWRAQLCRLAGADSATHATQCARHGAHARVRKSLGVVGEARIWPCIHRSTNAAATTRAEGYDRIELLGERLSAAAKALRVGYGAHGQWGIFDKGYNQTKTRFLNSWLCRYATRSKINTICELGFMAGHSSMLFLETSPDPQTTIRSAQVFSFDMYDNPWSLPQGKLMEHTYVQRFKLVVGLERDCAELLWERQHPRERCDAMFIDGVSPIHPLVPAAPPPSPLLEPARSFVFVHFQQQAPTPCTPFRQAKHLEPRLEDLRNFRRLSSQGAPVL